MNELHILYNYTVPLFLYRVCVFLVPTKTSQTVPTRKSVDKM